MPKCSACGREVRLYWQMLWCDSSPRGHPRLVDHVPVRQLCNGCYSRVLELETATAAGGGGPVPEAAGWRRRGQLRRLMRRIDELAK